MAAAETHGFDPIRSKAEDLLDRGPFVRRITDAVIDPKTRMATGVTIGITGPWGSGKSSILELLDEEISERYGGNAILLRFNPWLVSGAEDLIGQFFSDLAAALRPFMPPSVEANAVSDILDFAAELSPLANLVLPGAGVLFGTSLKATKKKLTRDQTLHRRRERIKAELKTLDRPIVVLVDELDRTEDDEIRTVARLIRSVADFESISYVVAYDHKRVVEALGGDDESRGSSYLEKIIHLAFPLPINVTDELVLVAIAEIKRLASEVGLPDNWADGERYRKISELLFGKVLSTPRDIKRFSSTLRILGGSAIRGEVDWVDLIGVAALHVKAPTTTSNIRQSPDSVVENPEDAGAVWRILAEEGDTWAERIAQVAPEWERSKSTTDLLGFLFPTLRSDDAEETRRSLPANLVRYRHPLLTTFRFGILPGYFSLQDVKDVVSGTTSQIKGSLSQYEESGRLANFLDRLETGLFDGSLKGFDHLRFWFAVKDFIDKPDCEWMTEYSTRHILCHELVRIFERYYQAHDVFGGAQILSALLGASDLSVAPNFCEANFLSMAFSA